MRPYRGLTKKGKWVYGWYCKVENRHYIVPDSAKRYAIDKDDPGFYGNREVIPETVGQSTGLKDKNGEDLDWWEGDIFKMHGHPIPWVIIEERSCFWFRCPVTKERKLCYGVAEYFNQPVKIGNIHENGNLLEEKLK